MYLQGVNSVYDLTWVNGPEGKVTYGDVFHQNEVEMSTYNFEKPIPKFCSVPLTNARPCLESWWRTSCRCRLTSRY